MKRYRFLISTEGCANDVQEFYEVRTESVAGASLAASMASHDLLMEQVSSGSEFVAEVDPGAPDRTGEDPDFYDDEDDAALAMDGK